MTIKNKDGSVYVIRGPNPAMKSQTVWDKTKISLINFNIGKNVETEPTNYKPVIMETPKPIVEKQVIPEPVIVKPIDPPVIVPEPKVVETIKTTKDKRIINMHCLPMTETGYSNKFIFEGVVLQESDMQMMFWTNVELGIGTIVFPKNERKRWWKIYENQPKNNGWFSICNPSDIQPDLS